MWIRIFQKLMHIYQTFGRAIIISIIPVRCSCKFTPTCSEYCLEKVKTRGILIGGLCASVRIVRCAFWTKNIQAQT